MRPSLVGLALAFLLSACGGGGPDASDPSGAAVHSTHGSLAKSGRRSELVGRWAPTLPPREARAVVTARAALAEPPNDVVFEAIGPNAEDRANYNNLLKLRATEPGSLQLATVRRKLAEYDAMLVEITDTSIGWKTPNAPELRQGYKVLAEDGDAVTVAVQDEQLDVRFLDKDHISMRGSTRTFLLTRDSAVATDAKTAVSAWNGEIGRPGRDSSPGRASAPSSLVVPAPGAPPHASGAARDACTAYADCIDEMPRLRGTEGGMAASSATIRSWEKTPERLRQCASALELAHAGALCP